MCVIVGDSLSPTLLPPTVAIDASAATTTALIATRRLLMLLQVLQVNSSTTIKVKQWQYFDDSM
jgi:hypothetical protein